MTLANIPVFTILPDWSDQVSETLEWLTAVLQGLRQGANGTAAEQRRMMRLSPRRSFDLNLVLLKGDRTYFDLLIHAAGASDFYVPIFHNVDVLRSGATAGDTSIVLPADPYNELVAFGVFVIIGPDGPSECEIFEGTFDGTTLTITTDGGLAKDWPKGARLYPAMRAKIATQPSFSEVSSHARTASIRFTSVGPMDWPSTGQEGFDSYNDFPVLVREPNWIDSLDGNFARTINTTDNQSGLWVYTDVSGRGFGTQTHTWYALSRKDHAAVRDMLYFLKGQLTGFWLPTFANDLTLAEYPVIGGTSLTIKWIGYSNLGFPVEGRDTIVIFMTDGSRQYATIAAAIDNVDGTETLGLVAPLTVDLNQTSFLKISFMQYSRFAQDAIEISHQTDNRGVSTISANISAISYDRDGPDWTPPPLNNPDMLTTGCGFVPAIFLTHAWGGCPNIGIPFGFNQQEVDFVEPADHIAYLNQTFGSNGDVTIRWMFERSDFTILYGTGTDIATLMNNRTSDRAGIPYSIDYDLGFFTDTNAICANTVATEVLPVLGGQVAQQGCHSVEGWVPSGNTLGVSVTVDKAGVGIGAGNVDYTFAVRIVAAGLNHDFSFADADDLPIAGTQFDFHVSIRADSAGNCRFIVTSTYHGTAIDQTYAAPEADGIFNFTLYHDISGGGRASNADNPVLENVITVSGLSVQA